MICHPSIYITNRSCFEVAGGEKSVALRMDVKLGVMCVVMKVKAMHDNE